jgi:ubiquinone/menaquinone biosynthesis C-methylase UbiE
MKDPGPGSPSGKGAPAESVDGKGTDARFERSRLLDPRKERKGRNRWRQLVAAAERICPEALEGPVLEFGFGIGHFLLEGLRMGLDVWGVDRRTTKAQRYLRLLEYRSAPECWKHRAVVAHGEDLPLPSSRFSAVASWYVLEHVEKPGGILREWVRILRPGGLIAVKAQDARNGWEGHYKVPWMPFLAGRLADAWLEAFGKARDPEKDVFEVTQPQIAAVLETLGCRVVEAAAPPQNLFAGIEPPTTPDQARAAGREVRMRWEAGTWKAQPENLHLYAVKR